MPEIKLHLDADTSAKSLQNALLARGHDVTRTPNEWVSSDADDEKQLMGATAQAAGALKNKLLATIADLVSRIKIYCKYNERI